MAQLQHKLPAFCQLTRFLCAPRGCINLAVNDALVRSWRVMLLSSVPFAAQGYYKEQDQHTPTYSRARGKYAWAPTQAM